MSHSAPEILSTRTSRILSWTIIAVYFVLAVSVMLTMLPESDEAAYANPGYNLAFNGHMGMTIFELRGYLPLSSAERCYWQPPFYFVFTAAWFKLFGFSVYQVRLISILFGALTIWSWSVITRHLTRSTSAALLVQALIASDFFFLTRAGHGRMELMCIGLGSAGLAIYAAFRKTHPRSALLWSGACATLSVLTHPVGMVWILALLLMMLVLDYETLLHPSRLWLTALAPYVLGGAAWLVFIMQDPTAFVEQMSGIIELTKEIFYDPNLSHIQAIQYLQQEILNRYLHPYGFLPGVSLASRLKILVLLAYLTGTFGILCVPRLRRQRTLLWFPLAYLGAFLVLTEVSPSKFTYYSPHVTVFLAACLGVFVYESGWFKTVGRLAAVVVVIGGIQVAGVLYLIYQNQTARHYQPLIQVLQQEAAPGSLVMGSNEFWFFLQPDIRLLNDHYLGYLSGLRPELIVMSPEYRGIQQRDEQDNPAAYQHIRAMLDGATSIYKNELYEVFRVKPAAQPSP